MTCPAWCREHLPADPSCTIHRAQLGTIRGQGGPGAISIEVLTMLDCGASFECPPELVLQLPPQWMADEAASELRVALANAEAVRDALTAALLALAVGPRCACGEPATSGRGLCVTCMPIAQHLGGSG